MVIVLCVTKVTNNILFSTLELGLMMEPLDFSFQALNLQLRRPTTNQSQRSSGDTILTWLRANVISSPFLITRCSLLTRSRFVQPSFCRDPFPIGTKEWKYPVDWLGPGSWVMTECPPDYLWDLCSSSQDPLRSLDTSPRLRDCYWQFLPPQDEWFEWRGPGHDDDWSEFLSRARVVSCLSNLVW